MIPDPRVLTAADRRAVAEGCIYDPARGAYVADWIEALCCHSRGRWAGQPLVLAPWQRRIVEALFGWRRADGTRRFRSAYIECPKKQGKSTLAAALALYLLVDDEEAGAQVYTVAWSRDQSSIVYREAVAMARASPELASRLRAYISPARLALHDGASFLAPLSRESRSQEGLNASAIIADELHVWRGRDLWDALRDAGAARRQPLWISITTAGTSLDSICGEQHRLAAAILADEIDDWDILPAIFAASREDDWHSPETWRRANPSLGVTIEMERIEEEYRRALTSPAAEANFKRRRLNLWIEGADSWLPLDAWDALADPALTLESLAGRECFLGLDLANTRDLCALALWFPGEPPVLLAEFWAPEGALEKERIQESRYRVWQRAGLLTLTPGAATDYEAIRARILALAEVVTIREVAYDPWNAAHFAQRLHADGLEVVEFRQGFASMTGPAKELESRVLRGTLRHGGHRVLRWTVENCSTEQDGAGNLKPSRRRSVEKIDGVPAALMALGRAMAAEVSGAGSVYDEGREVVI